MTGPLDPKGVAAENLRRWQESGQPRLWVEAHRGRWDHADWLALLKTLRGSAFWPLDPEAVGRLLEQMRGCLVSRGPRYG
jgi:hypothetical protein